MTAQHETPATAPEPTLEDLQAAASRAALLVELGEAPETDLEEAEAQVARRKARIRREKLAAMGQEPTASLPTNVAPTVDQAGHPLPERDHGPGGDFDFRPGQTVAQAMSTPAPATDADGVLLDESAFVTGAPFSLEEAPPRAETVDVENLGTGEREPTEAQLQAAAASIAQDRADALPPNEKTADKASHQAAGGVPNESTTPESAPARPVIVWASVAGQALDESRVLTQYRALTDLLKRDPDHAAHALAMSDLERKAQVESLEYLFHLQWIVTEELAGLEALFGGGSEAASADYRRKQHRNITASAILIRLREEWDKWEPTRRAEHEADQQGVTPAKVKAYRPAPFSKPPENELERLANADPEHVAFCDALELQRIRHIHLKTIAGQVATRIKAREQGLNVYNTERRANG